MNRAYLVHGSLLISAMIFLGIAMGYLELSGVSSGASLVSRGGVCFVCAFFYCVTGAAGGTGPVVGGTSLGWCLKPDIKKGFDFKDKDLDAKAIKNYSLSKMLANVLKIDVTKCERCNGDMAVMAALIDRGEVARYLKHVGIEHEAPTRAPPRHKEESFDFSAEYYSDEPVITLDR